MSKGSIGIPSAKGMKDAFIDFAVGAGGGLVYNLASQVLGGTLGASLAPVLVGSIVKGTRGTALSTIAGFLLLSGLGGQAPANGGGDNSGSRGVM